MRSPLRRAALDPDPITQFVGWQRDAAEHGDRADACVLATSSPGGVPTARAVLVKRVDDRGFAFITDARSRKAADVTANANAAMVFVWPNATRQVRVEGVADAVAADELETWWRARPLDSRLAAIASHQDAPIDGRDALDAALEAVRAEHGADPQRPWHFVGWSIEPVRIEFWQSATARLHDRFVYVRDTSVWRIARLQP